MNQHILFIIPDLHRSPESAALLERLYLIPGEEYTVSVFITDVCFGHYRKALDLIPAGVRLIKKIDRNARYDAAGVFSDCKSVQKTLKDVNSKSVHLYLFRNPTDGTGEFFRSFEMINTVSIGVKAALLREHPELAARTFIMPDDIRRQYLERLAYRRAAWRDMYYRGMHIVSSGPLYIHRHWDLALLTARILKKRRMSFEWYIIEPAAEDLDYERDILSKIIDWAAGVTEVIRLRILIKIMGLEDNVFIENNPSRCYEYIGQSDLFAAMGYESERDKMIEAALMLQKDIVATDSPMHQRQLQWEDGTYLSADDPSEFADMIFNALR